MKRITSTKLSTELLESHHYVCDLLRAEIPALALYTDGRQNWMYLWADTDSSYRHRFLLFTVSRKDLDAYLRKAMSLRAVLDESHIVWLLEELRTPARTSKEKERVTRHLWDVPTLEEVGDYLPTEDSLFEPSLAPDIDLTKDLLPERYDVPIKGTWFGRDFEYLFKRYERIYSFFYATQPRFVRTINVTLHRVLRAPWKGGYSRVNLYTRLAEVLPAQFALKIAKLNFASPGDVKFEAIPSIGESIRQTTLRYLDNEARIDKCSKRIRRILTSARLNRVDLSARSEGSIKLSIKQRKELEEAIGLIGRTLAVSDEMKALRDHSPNSVVFAKAVVSFARQVHKLANLQRQEMLNFHSSE
jgi:hypothetical protein